MKFLALPALIALITLSACKSFQGTNSLVLPDTMAQQKFQKSSWTRTTSVYTPDHWPESLVAEVIHPNASIHNLPIMLLVHGGGWQRRSYEDMQPLAEHWAKQGFITVNIAYRFAPEYQFPAQLHDAQLAMHWIDSKRAEWNSPYSPLVAFGFSSGAHLVSLMGNVAGQHSELVRPYGGSITRPNLVILGGLPSDLQKWDRGRLIEDFLGGPRAEFPERYALASPITHIHANTPPTFMFHGRLDRLVPPDHATDYYEALQHQRIPVELKMLSLKGHVTSFIFRGSSIRAAEEFINTHLNNRITDDVIGVK
ncbi:alpha/beta hydrolase [Nitrincola schmidtii]|uniref:alpha/beta hydrolase n=1 Tax=Nitrincola schmidtii TaxID=1730894 RepID=UPI001456EA29|nr:alpha/beta hydrolase [Nitrincola schmidtii]